MVCVAESCRKDGIRYILLELMAGKLGKMSTLELRILILVIEADGGRHYSIGWSKYPSHYQYKVHEVEHNAIADSKTFMFTYELDTFGGGELMPFAAVVKHGEAVIIAFHKEGKNRYDPSYNRDEAQDQQSDHVHGLPEHIAEGQFDTATHIFQNLRPVEGEVFPVEDGICFFAEIGEYRRAENEEKIFEQRKIEREEE